MHQHIQMLLAGALVILAIALVPACGTVPKKASPSDPAGNFAQVSRGVYRGGRPDERGVQALKEMGVRTIIDLENDDGAVASERAWAQANGLQFFSQPMNGLRRPRDQQVDEILKTMGDPGNQPVYVHCMEGVDRTGVIIALYRVLFEGWTPADAHDEMIARGYKKFLIAMSGYFDQKTRASN